MPAADGSFTPPEVSGRANGLVNIGGFSASLLTMGLVGVVLDVRAPGGQSTYDLGDFRAAMCVQYVFWAIGAFQVVRYRRKAVAHLARVQMRALFGEALARTSSLRYAGQPAYLRSNFQRGVKRLPISWTA